MKPYRSGFTRISYAFRGMAAVRPQPSQDEASRYLASLPPGQFPNLTALAGHFSAVDPDERFELLLDIFVDVIEVHEFLGGVGQRLVDDRPGAARGRSLTAGYRPDVAPPRWYFHPPGRLLTMRDTSSVNGR